MAGEEGVVLRLAGGGDQLLLQAERGELLHRMNADVDADAERAHFGRRLEHPDTADRAAALQRQRERQPADSAANDDRVHGPIDKASTPVNATSGRHINRPVPCKMTGALRCRRLTRHWRRSRCSLARPAERETFERRCQWRHANPKEWVLEQNDIGTDIYFLTSGVVRVLITPSPDREVILGDIEAGGYFGEMAAIDGQPRSAGILAITEASIARMSAAVFRDVILQHPDVGWQLLQQLVTRIRTLDQRVNEFSSMHVKNRIWAELLRRSRPDPTDQRRAIVSPPPVHSDIAARVSTRREMVARELKALERAGLVEQAPRRFRAQQCPRADAQAGRGLGPEARDLDPAAFSPHLTRGLNRSGDLPAMTAAAETKPESRPFEADVARLLHLMVHAVYSDKDVFLRELISNAPTPASGSATKPSPSPIFSAMTPSPASQSGSTPRRASSPSRTTASA